MTVKSSYAQLLKSRVALPIALVAVVYIGISLNTGQFSAPPAQFLFLVAGLYALLGFANYWLLGMRVIRTRSGTLTVHRCNGKTVTISRKDITRCESISMWRLGVELLRVHTPSGVRWFTLEGFSSKKEEVVTRLFRPGIGRSRAARAWGADPVFVPLYEMGHRAILLLGPVMTAVAIWAAISWGARERFAIAGAVFASLCTVAIWLTWIRRISFSSGALHIVYLGRVRRIDYSNIKNVGFSVIETHRGWNVSLQGIDNTGELLSLFDAAAARGMLTRSAVDGDLVIREMIATTAFGYALVPALIAGLATFFVSSGWVPVIVILVVFVISFGVIYSVMKRRSA